MSEYTIWHNPRCSKSRQTLALLQEHGIEPDVVLYLEKPPTQKAIRDVAGKLGIRPWELVRRKEAEFKEADISADSSDAAVVKAMSLYPKLIERPIVIRGEDAVIGRPPENVLGLIG